MSAAPRPSASLDMMTALAVLGLVCGCRAEAAVIVGAEGQTSSDSASSTSADTADATTGDDPDTETGDQGNTGMDMGMAGSLYCDQVVNWDPSWISWEDEVIVLVNAQRGAGAECGAEGSFGPAPPLTNHPSLRCSARNHSRDMVVRDFYSHTNPDGAEPADRMHEADYPGTPAGETIAVGSASPEAVLGAWMASGPHCAQIMNPDVDEVGVGYYPGGQFGHAWTQNFGILD